MLYVYVSVCIGVFRIYVEYICSPGAHRPLLDLAVLGHLYVSVYVCRRIVGMHVEACKCIFSIYVYLVHMLYICCTYMYRYAYVHLAYTLSICDLGAHRPFLDLAVLGHLYVSVYVCIRIFSMHVEACKCIFSIYVYLVYVLYICRTYMYRFVYIY